MNGFLLTGYLIYGIYQLANYLKKKDTLPEEDNSKPKYIINEVVSPIHQITKSFQVLGLNKGTLIDPRLINMVFSKQLEWANEDRLLGYKVKHSLKEYQLARDYLLDFYDYTAFLN